MLIFSKPVDTPRLPRIESHLCTRSTSALVGRHPPEPVYRPPKLHPYTFQLLELLDIARIGPQSEHSTGSAEDSTASQANLDINPPTALSLALNPQYLAALPSEPALPHFPASFSR